MPTSLDDSKSELLNRLCKYADERPASDHGGAHLDVLLRGYYRHVAPEDLLDRSEVDLYGAVTAQLKLADDRPQGTAKIKVFTPTVPVHGWSAEGHTVVEVVTDDMPFLVDSVSMALGEQQHDVHLVIHPQFVVRRDLTGALQEILDDGAATSAHDVERESWMHLEIDRVPDEELPVIQQALEKTLTDVREAVEDWAKMHAQVDEIVADLDQNPPPLPAEELDEGKALLRWLADNHFTFLGYREYKLALEDGREVLTGVTGTGFGILRSDPTAPSVLPPPAAAMAR